MYQPALAATVFLLYRKVGWGAYRTRFTINDTATGAELASESRTRGELDAGVGGEWRIAPNWSLWIEWDHIFAERKTVVFLALGGATADIRRDFDKVLLGIN